MESAGVTLVKGDLRGIVRARRLSRITLRNIKQDLLFAFIYKAAGVPIAAGLLYPLLGVLLSPMIAAAAMSFSSVSVIGNALRLRRGLNEPRAAAETPGWGVGPETPSHPRYTRDVGLYWLRGISLAVLLVLALVPVSGTVCAALCMPGGSAGSVSGGHHASSPLCHDPVSGHPRVDGTSGHDCDRHTAPAHEATATLTAAVRSDFSLIAVTQLVGPGAPNLFALTSVRTHSGSSPPGPAAPTRTPLVLRI